MRNEIKTKIYDHLLNKYKDKQLIVAIEELSELQKEFCKALRGQDNIKNIIEEMADVEIMLEQMKIYLGIDEDVLVTEKIYKLWRVFERELNGSKGVEQ